MSGNNSTEHYENPVLALLVRIIGFCCTDHSASEAPTASLLPGGHGMYSSSPSTALSDGSGGVGSSGCVREGDDNQVPEQSRDSCENELFEEEATCSSFGNKTHYNVFLNHRGPDLKGTFASHLYKALHQAGCYPFLDQKSMVIGQLGWDSIKEVLAGVLVHVAIFSPGYAQSKSCLDELCAMLASERPLIPVFFDVEPKDLSNTEVGKFGEAFRQHMKEKRDEDVKKWKVALGQASEISGIRLSACDNDTVKLEERVVVAVLDALGTSSIVAPARYPVGLEKPSMHIIEMLNKMKDNVGVVGICGMGGIGKTTLAREVYNQQQSKFSSSFFVKNLKSTKGVDFTNLQKEMVAHLLCTDSTKLHWNSAQWFDQICKQKVLLVIDDISERKQVEELIPSLKDLARGSQVLITSRERDVLKNTMDVLLQSQIYSMPELSDSNSLDLFVRCAFHQDSIDDVDASFQDFAREIARACNGLPLALEVMGGYLIDKKNLLDDDVYWKDARCALRNHGDVMSILEMSYNNLKNDNEKRMFLDIACFMLGQPKHIAMEVWECNGDYGSVILSLNTLIEKCLVKIDDGQLSMHDLLRDMGRNVVSKKAGGKLEMLSHIWDPLKATEVLQKNQGLENIMALSVVGQRAGLACKAEQYEKMGGLKYILLDDCPVDGDFSGWSKELTWLRWRNMPHEGLPPNLNLSNLVVLDLSSSNNLTHISTKNFEFEFTSPKVRVLLLMNCNSLTMIPQDINRLSEVKFVDLEGCSNLTLLPNSFHYLKQLEYLNLTEYVMRAQTTLRSLQPHHECSDNHNDAVIFRMQKCDEPQYMI